QEFAPGITLLLQPVSVDQFRSIIVWSLHDCHQKGLFFGHDLAPEPGDEGHFAAYESSLASLRTFRWTSAIPIGTRTDSHSLMPPQRASSISLRFCSWVIGLVRNL